VAIRALPRLRAAVTNAYWYYTEHAAMDHLPVRVTRPWGQSNQFGGDPIRRSTVVSNVSTSNGLRRKTV
jgi:hypothetical protein